MPASEISPKRVLIVDDSKFVRTTFKSILSASFAVLEEGDGEAGWRTVSTDASVVMVFTDLDMPRLDGFGLLARIRGSSDARIRELPVVIISGNEEAATKERARAAGANDFIAKSADAPEVLSRIDNLLRLVRTSKALAASSEALSQTATHDLLTGALTPHGLLSEGRKYYASSRRHGGELTVMALRVDSHDEVSRHAGKDVADQLLARIGKLMLGTLRAGDSLGRIGPATFALLAPGTAAPPMRAVAARIREQLQSAQVGYRGQSLQIACSFGVASLALDAASSIEDLIRLAVQRVEAPAPARAPPAAGLGQEIEHALRVLEAASRGPLGGRAEGLLRRLLAIAKTLKAGQE